LQAIVRAICDWLRSQAAQPFVFPAMGSHGGDRRRPAQRSGRVRYYP
jgi:hypothetical protein